MRSRLVRLAVVAAVAGALVAAPGTANAMTLSPGNAEAALTIVDGLLAQQGLLDQLRAAMMVDENWAEGWLKFQPIAHDALDRTRLRLEQLQVTLEAAMEDEKVPAGRAHGQAASAIGQYQVLDHTIALGALPAIAQVGDQVEAAFQEIEGALDPSPPPEENCFNMIDDDGDGLVDLEDPDCLTEVP